MCFLLNFTRRSGRFITLELYFMVELHFYMAFNLYQSEDAGETVKPRKKRFPLRWQYRSSEKPAFSIKTLMLAVVGDQNWRARYNFSLPCLLPSHTPFRLTYHDWGCHNKKKYLLGQLGHLCGIHIGMYILFILNSFAEVGTYLPKIPAFFKEKKWYFNVCSTWWKLHYIDK